MCFELAPTTVRPRIINKERPRNVLLLTVRDNPEGLSGRTDPHSLLYLGDVGK